VAPEKVSVSTGRLNRSDWWAEPESLDALRAYFAGELQRELKRTPKQREEMAGIHWDLRRTTLELFQDA
jgi:hypothetical protein